MPVNRRKRSTNAGGNGIEIAQILNDGTICFAGRKLPIRAPSNAADAEMVREALNTFILLMSHMRGKNAAHFQFL